MMNEFTSLDPCPVSFNMRSNTVSVNQLGFISRDHDDTGTNVHLVHW